MVLDDVANHTRFVVEAPPAFHAEIFGHRDLHVLDILPVPDWLEKRVGEAEIEDVLNSFLAEIVVDSEDRVFVEDVPEDAVQLTSGRQVAPERFLDDDAAVRR